jgi:hypothetical protein
MKPSVVVMLAVCAIVAAGASEARAQMTMGTFKGYLTGHVGMATGGDITDDRMAAGASVAVHETTGWGAEIDFGRSTDLSAGPQLLDLTTYTANALWVRPSGMVRPFGGAGAGVLQVDGCMAPCGFVSRTFDLGVSLGGGAFVTLNDVAAIRADARYFFTPADHPELGRADNLKFWRLSIGATFMWAIVP